jgi:ATP-binding cassette, subfamily B, bacterial
MKTNFGRILYYIWPHVKNHWVSFSLVFIGYGIGIIFDTILKPFLYKEIIDTLSSVGSKDIVFKEAMKIGFIICGTIIIFNTGYRLGDYANSYFQSKVMKSLHDFSFGKILQHSYDFFSNNFSGSIVAKSKRFTKSFETLADIVSFQIFFSLVTIIGIFIVLLLEIPILAYIFLVWSLFYILITFLFIRYKIKYDVLEAQADSSVTGYLADAIMNVLNIKIFSGNEKEKDEFYLITKDEENKRREAWYFGNLQNAFQAFLMAILQIVAIFVMIDLWYKDILSIGVIVLVQLYMFNLFDILWNLGRSMTKAIKAITDMKEVVDIFDLPIGILDPENPEQSKIKDGYIKFENISFSYKGGINIFENFSLEIKPGERIGLVGHSGAGKSTITKLLLRFSDVMGGSITIDGQDIRMISQNDLRSAIAYVPQESILFHRTIKENIIYSRPESTQEEIETVAKKAHAHEFILSLPKGYNTLVGERGVKLSGGERQRVAIARAMLKDSPILVLDEATSSLDSVSESYIQDAFTELMKGKTTLVIAHRLSTIQKMDRIVVLEDGNIVEMGTHKELLDKEGVYANLWEHQSGGFIE